MEFIEIDNLINMQDNIESCVLIVDDNPATLKALKLCFEVKGFRIICAGNGCEALVQLKSNKFSIMLTDYNMPGMNGLELSEEARKTHPELTIIMMSGDTLELLRPKSVKSGINAILAKPLDLKELFGICMHGTSNKSVKL